MTAKHKQAIRDGLKKLHERRRRSAAMLASWNRRRNDANASNNTSAQVVRLTNEEPKMPPERLIAEICREYDIKFTLGDLDDLVVLCQEFHRRHDEVTI